MFSESNPESKQLLTLTPNIKPCHPRASTSASYNPAIEATELDRSKISIRMIAASKRSERQAYFIVQQWLQRAMSSEEAPAKKRKT